MSEYSEEVQDIVDRMPTRWCAWTALLVLLVVASLFVMGFVIQYPDTVDGMVSVTGAEAPVRMVAASGGRLHLLQSQGTDVAPGDAVAYLGNGASYEDVGRLKRSLEKDDDDKRIEKGLNVGELAEHYNRYIIAEEHWERLVGSDLHANMRRGMEEQIIVNKRVTGHIRESMAIKSMVCANYYEEYRRDSTLASRELVSKSQLEKTLNAYLSQLDAEVSLRNSLLTKEAEISASRMEIARSHIDEEESVEEAYVDMMVKRNILKTQLRLWEEKYVLKAPVYGRLQYLGFWRENVAVQSGMELFSLIPHHNELVGEANIPAHGAGKVCVGQQVNVKLNEHPYDEFGILKGVVADISPLTNKVQQNGSIVETYQVLISFPNGATTNFGRTLSLNFESKGSAEIITAPKRLVERLFDNLKAGTTK